MALNADSHRQVRPPAKPITATEALRLGASRAQPNAVSMISCCSTACTFDDPDDGADMARREIRLMPLSLSGNTSGSVSPNDGHAPWLAGSSWTQKYCLAFS